MRRLALTALLPVLLLLSGCFQVFSTLTVRADGSAQLVEEISLEGMAAMSMMDGGLFGGIDSSAPSPEAFEARARSYGDGVTLAASERVVAPGRLTYRLTYDIADVSAFAYDIADASSLDSPGSLFGPLDGSANATAGEDSTRYRFAFDPATDGAPAALRIAVPSSQMLPTDADLDDLPDDPVQELEGAMLMFGTLATRFAVAVEGDLVEADRGWVDGDRIVLSSITMAEFLPFLQSAMTDRDVAALEALQSPETDLEVPGVRTLLPGDVTVRFR